MWAEYFDKAKIFGIDCFEKKLQLGPRVTLLRGSQDDPGFLAKISRDHGPFEIVIDDGSHHPAHVVASFHGLFASVSDGGFYVIEDAQAAYWPSFGGSVDGSHTIALVRSVFELLNHSEIPIENPDFAAPLFAKTIRSFQAYHNLLIFEKGDNSAPSNKRYDPSNRHAASAISSMKHELSHSPTAEGLANLARLYLIRNEPSEAINTINHGLTIAPRNVTLLLAASDVAAATGNCHDRLAFAERASQQSPYDGALQLHLELIRSDLANQKEL
jgi:hypothetical protein